MDLSSCCCFEKIRYSLLNFKSKEKNTKNIFFFWVGRGCSKNQLWTIRNNQIMDHM